VTPEYAVYVGLVLSRVGAFVAVMPPFATRTPRTVRAAFAIALTAFYMTSAAPTTVWDAEFARAVSEAHPLRYALALVREALLGASMGFAFALFLLPARIAGEFVTQQIGLNAAQALGPTGDGGAGPLTNAFETAGGLLFLGLNGHHTVLIALHASFGLLPLGGDMLPVSTGLEPGQNPMFDGLTSAYEMGLLLAAPLAICLFLLSVALAIMTRAAPQLNVYSIGFTLQVTVVLIGTLFLLPEIVRSLGMIVDRTSQSLPRFFGG
jgi:flagellar biosynthetic protein FliR